VFHFLAPQLNKRKSRFNGAPHSGIFDRRISPRLNTQRVPGSTGQADFAVFCFAFESGIPDYKGTSTVIAVE